MITIDNILSALRHLAGHVVVLDETEVAILSTLKVYRVSCHFDGSLASAIICLQVAGYQVETPELVA